MPDIPIEITLSVHAFASKEPEKQGSYLVWLHTNWVEVIELLWNGEWWIPSSALYTKADIDKALYWSHLPTIKKGGK